MNKVVNLKTRDIILKHRQQIPCNSKEKETIMALLAHFFKKNVYANFDYASANYCAKYQVSQNLISQKFKLLFLVVEWAVPRLLPTTTTTAPYQKPSMSS